MSIVEKRPFRLGGHVLVVLFVVYLVLLVWTVVWKLEVPDGGEAALLPRPIKLDPVRAQCRGRCERTPRAPRQLPAVHPVRAYVGLLAPTWQWWKRTGVFVGASFVLETTQHLLSTGTFDTTDVIVNTVGGLVGVGLLAMARRRLQVQTAAVMTRAADRDRHLPLLAVGTFVASPLHYAQQRDVVVSTPVPSR